MPDTLPPEGIVLSPRRSGAGGGPALWRSAGDLGALALLFFLVTLVRLGANVGSRPF